jgi:hypothetical protein
MTTIIHMDARLVRLWQYFDQHKGDPDPHTAEPAPAESQAGIAERLGINRTSVHRYRSGDQEPSLLMYGRLWGAVVARSLGLAPNAKTGVHAALHSYPEGAAYTKASRLGMSEMLKAAGIPLGDLMAQSMEMIP